MVLKLQDIGLGDTLTAGGTGITTSVSAARKAEFHYYVLTEDSTDAQQNKFQFYKYTISC